MKKYRIVANEEDFAIQYKTFLFWYFVKEYSRGYRKDIIHIFDTLEEAEKHVEISIKVDKCIQEENSKIPEPWKVVKKEIKND